jgi:2-polyprenyl-6-methoxyphenol hydroxylase-like FAD-dependent oxidoreductase
VLFGTACVLGGSIAGLLAALVLADHAERVVMIERDAPRGRGCRRDPGALKMAMRVNLEPGISVDSVAGKLARFAESGMDEAFVDAIAVFPSLDQTADFASKLIARTGRL